MQRRLCSSGETPATSLLPVSSWYPNSHPCGEINLFLPTRFPLRAPEQGRHTALPCPTPAVPNPRSTTCPVLLWELGKGPGHPWAIPPPDTGTARPLSELPDKKCHFKLVLQLVPKKDTKLEELENSTSLFF